MINIMNRLAETSDGVYDYVKNNIQRQMRFNTLGDGCFFLTLEYNDLGEIYVLNKIESSYLCRKATDSEYNDLFKWLDRDMIQVEEKRGVNWIAIHEPKGKSFN